MLLSPDFVQRWDDRMINIHPSLLPAFAGLNTHHRALDAGINFVDTADMYSAGESEEIVGKALAGRRDDVVLATKVHFPLGEGRNRSGNSRRYVVRAVEDSLRRLGTDWIDLYQVHRPDYTTDVEETLSVLTDLVREGKIRAFGCSTFPAEEIAALPMPRLVL